MPHRFRELHMRPDSMLSRALAAGVLVIVVGGLSACAGKSPRGYYALPVDERPLEVPPEFAAAAAPVAPVAGSASSAAAAVPAEAPAGSAFDLAGDRAAVFARLGDALAGIDGVEVVSKAELLGVYDLAYEGANVLLRASDVGGGTVRVSAVDPRGQPATGEAALKLVATLKARLAD